MRRFEFVEGTSSKFWEIEVRGSTVISRYGRIGQAGRETEKPFASTALAEKAAAAQVREKKRKGYAEVGSASEVSAAVGPGSPSRLQAALTSIEAWMRANGAPNLADNLAPGASEAELERVQKEIGVGLPESLRELYRLHDGQPRDGACFIGFLSFLPLRQVKRERESFLRRYVEGGFNLMGYRENRDVSRDPILEIELSDRWWPIARMDSDFLAVNLDSQRVFRVEKDVPAFSLAADDIVAFFEGYAHDLAAGKYALESEDGGDRLIRKTPRGGAVPGLPGVARSNEPPRQIVQRVFAQVLGENRFFEFQDMSITDAALIVELGLHAPRAWHARLAAHPVIQEPVRAFTRALVNEKLRARCSVKLQHVESGPRQLAASLRGAGPLGAELLRQLA